MEWRKSTYSANGGAACIETASDSGVIMIRDTVNRTGFTLEVSASAWEKFTASIR
jgi:hypothetical protein